MKIMVLGADGYIGYPVCRHLKTAGHEVFAIDNDFKRVQADRLGLNPLVGQPLLPQRALKAGFHYQRIDVANEPRSLAHAIDSFKPNAIIHLAEQPSGPYSMIDKAKAGLTMHNNLTGTLNLAWTVLEHAPDCQIVKLGTMGEYGTPPIAVPEGWMTLTHPVTGETQRRLFPRQAGSWYHTCKILETDMLYFYSRHYGLKVTDIMQGPVYGWQTDESQPGEIETMVWYDHVFGTVLNRFLVQAVAGHPLTVYGAGGQTRGYINLTDSVEALRLVCENPTDEFRVINQFTETFTVNQLAIQVQAAAAVIGLEVQIQNIPNPRQEAEMHFYNPEASTLQHLGLKATYLTVDRLAEMLQTVQRYKDRINTDHIMPNVYWRGHEPK